MPRSGRSRLPASPTLARGGPGPFQAYYLLTPVFWVSDVLFHAPIRVAGIGPESWRWAYYAGLVAIGVACRLWPRSAPFLALVEGSGNLLLLILSVLLPIWDATLEPMAAAPGIDGWAVANFVLVAPFTVLAIKRAEWAIARR